MEKTYCATARMIRPLGSSFLHVNSPLVFTEKLWRGKRGAGGGGGGCVGIYDGVGITDCRADNTAKGLFTWANISTSTTSLLQGRVTMRKTNAS